MGRTEFSKAVSTMKRVLGKFAEWGLTAGFVYTTEDGFLQFYGSEAVGHVIDQHRDSIMHHPAFSHQMTEDDVDYIPEDAGNMVTIYFSLNQKGGRPPTQTFMIFLKPDYQSLNAFV